MYVGLSKLEDQIYINNDHLRLDYYLDLGKLTNRERTQVCYSHSV